MDEEYMDDRGEAEDFGPEPCEQDEISEAIQAWGADDLKGRAADDFDDTSDELEEDANTSDADEDFPDYESRGDEDTGYCPTEKLEKVYDMIRRKLKEEATSPPGKEALKGGLKSVQKAIDRVRRGESDPGKEELYLADRLVSSDEIDALEQRWQNYEDRYQEIDQEIESGERSIESSEVDLLDIRYHQMRLETQGGMMAEGLTWDRLGDLSDDANHLVEDSESPRLRDARKAFRDIDWTKQREVLEKAVEKGVVSPEQAKWMWNQWR